MNIKEEINRFLDSEHMKGLYMIYAKDVINDSYCDGIYFIHEDLYSKPKFKKITHPKKSINIILIETIYVK